MPRNLAVCVLLGLGLAACQPGREPAATPTPDSGVKLKLVAAPSRGDSPLTVRLTAEVVGQPKDPADFRCPSLAWVLGNGDVLITHDEDCTGDRLQRSFMLDYTYHSAGNYTAYVRLLASDVEASNSVSVLALGPTPTAPAVALVPGPTIVIATSVPRAGGRATPRAVAANTTPAAAADTTRVALARPSPALALPQPSNPSAEAIATAAASAAVEPAAVESPGPTQAPQPIGRETLVALETRVAGPTTAVPPAVLANVTGTPAGEIGPIGAEATAGPGTSASATPAAARLPAATATRLPPTSTPTRVVSPAPTRLPPTATVIVPTAVPPTAVPPTAVPPTAVPPTAVPPTVVPPTAVPPTVVPPALVPSTRAAATLPRNPPAARSTATLRIVRAAPTLRAVESAPPGLGPQPGPADLVMTPERIPATPGQPAALPSGSTPERVLPADLYYLAGAPARLWRFPASGAAPRPLTGAGEAVDGYAVTSSGVFAYTTNGALRLVLPDNQPRTLAERGASAPVWSQDGRRLAYAVRDGAQTAAHVYDLAGGRDLRLAADGTPLAWSREATWLLMRRGDGLPVVVYTLTGAQTVLPVGPLADAPGVGGWLPDRDVVWLAGDGLRLVTFEDTLQLTRLLPDAAHVTGIFIRPDLRLLAMVDAGKGPVPYLVDLTADALAPAPIGGIQTASPSSDRFAWSPDGRNAAVADRDGLALVDPITAARVGLIGQAARMPRWVIGVR